jgi:hypothetical protein
MRVAGVHARYMTSDSLPGEDRAASPGSGLGTLGAAPLRAFSDQPAAAAAGDVRAANKIGRGFRFGEAKLAFHYGDIESAVPLPRGLLDVLRANAPSPLPGQKRWSRPLLITHASPDSAEFATDCGRRKFRAWQLGGPEVDGAFCALDPAIAATCWQPPEPEPRSRSTVSRTGGISGHRTG